MAMVNMKRDAEREEMPGEVERDEPQYPYGLCIRLGKDELEKLGITALPKVGTEMMVMAKGFVESTSAYETQGEGTDMSVKVQITDIEVGAASASGNAATALYGA
jgi:hypothetical protein